MTPYVNIRGGARNKKLWVKICQKSLATTWWTCFLPIFLATTWRTRFFQKVVGDFHPRPPPSAAPGWYPFWSRSRKSWSIVFSVFEWQHVEHIFSVFLSLPFTSKSFFTIKIYHCGQSRSGMWYCLVIPSNSSCSEVSASGKPRDSITSSLSVYVFQL